MLAISRNASVIFHVMLAAVVTPGGRTAAMSDGARRGCAQGEGAREKNP